MVREDQEQGSAIGGAILIVVIGSMLGLGFNYLGLQSNQGVPWIAVDPMDRLQEMETVTASELDPDAFLTDVTDPLAVPGDSASKLPEIPAVGRPVQIELGALKQYWDAGAALIADAREDWEYEESHIAGAVSLPYDMAVTDPVRLETLTDRDRPIIVYCGGGACELSIKLADELIFSGYQRVAVFMGGFPEWVEAGYPVADGKGDS